VFSAFWQVEAVNVFSGVTDALLNVAFVAYFYDISPAGHGENIVLSSTLSLG
jgi:hypothetical protein